MPTRQPRRPWANVTCPTGIDVCSEKRDTAHHVLSHVLPATAGGVPATMTVPQSTALACIMTIQTFFMEQLTYFANRLASYADPAGGTLLDSSAVLTVSEVAEGPSHSSSNMPFLVLGGAAGALKPGHFDFKNTRSNDLFITLAHALGLRDVTTFGDPMFVKGPLTELLA